MLSPLVTKPSIRLALAQINPVLGGFVYNQKKILTYVEKAKAVNATIVAFPEMAISGYPPEDLILLPDFINTNYKVLRNIAQASQDIITVTGFIDAGEDVYNAVAVLSNGEIVAKCYKMYLPNYGVFDEQRYFSAGTHLCNLQIEQATIGLNICEDIWSPEPTGVQTQAGAKIILNISASPYYRGKLQDRVRMLRTRAIDNGVVIAYCNLVGGQDELVFDGASLVIDANGIIIGQAKQFEEDFLVVDIDLTKISRDRLLMPLNRHAKKIPATIDVQTVKLDFPLPDKRTLPAISSLVSPPLPDMKEVFQALTLAVHDYVFKNKAKQVFIGISGGVDSALTTAIAASAIGAKNVTGVSMPSRYSSKHSIEDATELAKNLGINFLQVPIDDIYQAYLNSLQTPFAATQPNKAEENIQARIRGNILMALCNKFHGIVLTTNNKTELAIGHCALYGDMSGGYSVLKDVSKTTVYALAEWFNQVYIPPKIPEHTLKKPSSAELRPNHEDKNILPPYSILDDIVQNYVEQNESPDNMVSKGLAMDVVAEFVNRINKNEYKRRQGAIGPKISPRAFGRDWRIPVTNQYISPIHPSQD